MGVAKVDIEVQRNADYVRLWTLLDHNREPIDLTGATFKLAMKYNAGAVGSAIAEASFTVIDAVNGILEVNIEGNDFSAVAGNQERVVLAYDCIMTQDGDEVPIARGAFILLPGVS